MRIGVNYLPGKNKNNISFGTVKQVYDRLLNEGVFEDVWLQQVNMQVETPYRMHYTPTVIIYDPDTGQELSRLECNFTLDQLKKAIRKAAQNKKSPRFLGLSKYNFGCWMKENWFVILCLFAIAFLVWKAYKK